jgi:hypothetical protein
VSVAVARCVRVCVAAQASTRVAVLYTAFGEWSEELEWEFLRLAAHVTRSPLLTSHDVVLLWETDDTAAAGGGVDGAPSPLSSPAIAQLLSENSRVRVHHVTTQQASEVYPSVVLQHGFYYNPEVAALMFLRAHPHASYDFVWLMEADVRWTVRPLPACLLCAVCWAQCVVLVCGLHVTSTRALTSTVR